MCISGQGITGIACGSSHSACARKDGCIYTWGDNQAGQCGCNPSEQKSIPSPTLLELSTPDENLEEVFSTGRRDNCVRIACGSQHTIALSAEGNIWVWGKGPQLGLGEEALVWRPTILKTFCDKCIVSICAGDHHNIVLVQDGTVDLKEQKSKSPVRENRTDSAKRSLLSKSPKSPSAKKSLSYRTSSESSVSCKQTEQKPKASEQPVVASKEKDMTVDKASVKEKDIATSTVSSKSADSQQVVKKDIDNDKSATDVPSATREDSDASSDTRGENKTESKSNTELDVETEGVKLREKGTNGGCSNTSIMATSSQSDTSLTSSVSSRVSRSRSFLDETGAREFLARQFQDDDGVTSIDKSDKKISKHDTVASSPGTYVLQTVSTLTNQVTSMTSKALSNIVSVPGKLGLTASGLADDENKSSTENLDISEISDLESGSTENINLDSSVLDFSNLTISDTSINASQLSLPESETSFSSTGGSVEGSPQTPKRNQSSKSSSVSKESHSIRTIEAKQENLRKRSLSLLTTEGMLRGLNPTIVRSPLSRLV